MFNNNNPEQGLTKTGITSPHDKTDNLNKTYILIPDFVNPCAELPDLKHKPNLRQAAPKKILDISFFIFPFDGDANDASGNGNDGTVNGATLTEDRFGNADSAYEFDGINDKIEIPDNFNMLAPSILTISVWAMRIGKNGGWGKSGMILYKGSYDPAPNMAYSIETLDDTYSLVLRSDTAGGGNIEFAFMELNKWYHLLGVFDNSTKQKSFYVNGELHGRLDFDGEINNK